MKNILHIYWLLFGCFLCGVGTAQNTQQVTAIQYYFNTDPGVGTAGNRNVLAVTPTANYSQTFPVNIPATLPVGFNTVMVRAKDEFGRWSIAERSTFYVLPTLSTNINAYQYFFDTEPGLGIAGNGNVVSITPTSTYTNASLSVPIPSTIGYGLHTLYFRTRNTNGQWSIAERSSFYYLPQVVTGISAYQYYFDTDPGVGVAGNGSVVNVSSTTAFNQALTVSYPSNLSAGFHTLFFRTRGTNGQWSVAERSSFYVLPQLSSNINAYQYYFDTDPGLGIAGNGNVVSITPTSNYTNTSLNVPIPSTVGYGLHTLYFRTRNTNGQWSIAERSSFYYLPQVVTSINAYQYYFDTDPGLGVNGNGSVVNITPTAALNQIIAVSYPSNLTAGEHVLYFRTRSTDGTWSIAERSNFSVPAMIVAYQYYFDTDPGVGVIGNGNIVTVTPAPSLTQQLNIIIPPSLTEGFHNLYVRTLNSLGAWSIAERHNFLVKANSVPVAINAYQYYFDNDPDVGVNGNGNVVNIAASSSLTQSLNIAVPPILNSGFHNMYVRTRSTNGEWSIAERHVFFKDSTIKSQTITNAEYFFDTDPGVGNGYAYTNFGPISNLNINDTLTVQLPCLNNGTHFMYMRTRDSFGRWAIAERDTVIVAPGIARPSITALTDTSYCLGDSVVLSIYPPAGITCQWHQNGLPIPGATSPNYVAYTSGSYTVEIFCAANSASTGSDPITVTAQAPATYYRDYDGDGFGSLANFLTTCVTPIGYVLNSTDCNDSSSTVYPGAPEICFNGIDENCNGQIDEGCCTSSVAATSITSDAVSNEICNGSNVMLTLNGGTLGTNANWKWYKNTCGGLANAVGTGTNITVSPTATTTYFVRAEGCDTSACVQITIVVKTAPPSASVIVPPINNLPAYACNGTSVVNINVPTVAGATSYNWDAPAGTTFNNGMDTYTSPTPSANILFGSPSVGASGYYIGVQAANACGTTLRKVQWVRNSVSVPATIIPANGRTTECANTTANYSIAAVGGATSYLWNITGNATVTGSGTTATVTFGATWTGGTLSVAAQTPCYTSASKSLVLTNSAPAIGTMSGTFSVCIGTTQTYSVPSTLGVASYAWSLPQNVTGTSTGNSINVTFNTGFVGGNISVTATSICGVVTAARTKTIVLGTPPTPASINGASNGLCNASVSYSCPPQSGVTFTWSSSTGIISNGQGTNSASINFGAFTTGTVSVVASNSCGASNARTISVKGAPNTPGIITANPAVWCNNDAGIQFTSSLAGLSGAYNLNWTVLTATASNYVSGQGTNSYTVDWITGNATVSLTATNACGSGTRTFAATTSCREAEHVQSEAGEFVKVFPNPATDKMIMEFAAGKTEAIKYQITDATGKVIVMEKLNVQEGLNSKQIDISKISKGVYILNVILNDKPVNVKVVIQ